MNDIMHMLQIAGILHQLTFRMFYHGIIVGHSTWMEAFRVDCQMLIWFADEKERVLGEVGGLGNFQA